MDELFRDILNLKIKAVYLYLKLKRSDIQFKLYKNHLHIPEVKHKTSKDCAFLWNPTVSPLCAEKIDAANILGMEISESCNKRKNTKNLLIRAKNKRKMMTVKWSHCDKFFFPQKDSYLIVLLLPLWFQYIYHLLAKSVYQSNSVKLFERTRQIKPRN